MTGKAQLGALMSRCEWNQRVRRRILAKLFPFRRRLKVTRDMGISLPRKDMINWVVKEKYNPFCVLNERPVTFWGMGYTVLAWCKGWKIGKTSHQLLKATERGTRPQGGWGGGGVFLKKAATSDSWWNWGDLHLRKDCLSFCCVSKRGLLLFFLTSWQTFRESL